MEVTFKEKKLKKMADNYSKSLKDLGTNRAKLFHKRLNDLYNAETLEDVRNLPGNYHELANDRKEQWACSLDNPYRLVVEPHEEPIPTDKDGKYIWIEIKGVEIIEIVDYH